MQRLYAWMLHVRENGLKRRYTLRPPVEEENASSVSGDLSSDPPKELPKAPMSDRKESPGKVGWKHALLRPLVTQPSTEASDRAGGNGGRVDIINCSGESANTSVDNESGVEVYEGPRLLRCGLDDFCLVCSLPTEEQDADRIVLCDFDGCSAEVHLHCLGLSAVPSSQWFCSRTCHRRAQWASDLEAQQRQDLTNGSSFSARPMSSKETQASANEPQFRGRGFPGTLPLVCDPR